MPSWGRIAESQCARCKSASVGAVTIATLPIAQFPNIAPSEIRLQATYPGVDAKTLEDAVAVPIEQQVNGVDNMSYMYSLNATANQQTTLLVDFDLKTDPNTDLLLTQSREQLATGQLPPSVNSYGVSLKKSTTAPLMLIALYSPHGTHDANYLANYGYINLNDPVERMYGVGQTQGLGSGQYAMRLWVKPDQLAKLGITVTDISNAIQAQNTVNPAGQVGGEPAPKGQQFTYAVLALAGLLLRQRKASNGLLQRFFNGFNRLFERATGSYVRGSGVLLRKGAVVLVLLVICGAAGLFFGSRLPSSFLPDDDQGYLVTWTCSRHVVQVAFRCQRPVSRLYGHLEFPTDFCLAAAVSSLN